MFKRGWGQRSLSLLPVLALGACVTMETRFAEVEPRSVELDGKTVEVRVIEAGEKDFDVHADQSDRGTFGARVQWKQMYTDATPGLHDFYVEASKKMRGGRPTLSQGSLPGPVGAVHRLVPLPLMGC